MDYTDSHLHLPLGEERDGFRGGIVSSARQCEWSAVLDACDAKKYYPCIGVHPWYVLEENEAVLNELEGLLRDYTECGVGEIGLDGCPGRPAMDIQRRWFRHQLELAAKFDRIAILHVVHAWDDAYSVMREFPNAAMIIHGFHGTSNDVRRFLSFPNLYFSLGFDAMRPGRRLLAAICSIPNDRLLVDSDAPFMGHESAELPQLITAVAAVKKLPAEFLSKQIAANWQKAVSGLSSF
ncbi:MAG: TatD family hydrolase [Lentisphaeria bacterium]|nr:TatD family hydrolase [Lentisphaeria bacterium]